VSMGCVRFRRGWYRRCRTRECSPRRAQVRCGGALTLQRVAHADDAVVAAAARLAAERGLAVTRGDLYMDAMGEVRDPSCPPALLSSCPGCCSVT